MGMSGETVMTGLAILSPTSMEASFGVIVTFRKIYLDFCIIPVRMINRQNFCIFYFPLSNR
jgi:hypothetical protein